MLVVGLLYGGHVLVVHTAASGGRHTDAAGSSSPRAEPSGSPGPGRGRSATERKRPAKDAGKVRKSGSGKSRPRIPSTGPGTFATAPGGGAAFGGTRRVLTYRVEAENGIGISPNDVAAVVDRVLEDPRGWTADQRTGFRRVSGDTSDFRIRLATAGTVDHICGEYGLDTGGELNCDVGQNVMVNLKRWEVGSQYYAHDIPAYRALIINHEVGHFLGHGHEGCPGPGRPAPVMMQQIKGLHGCTVNVWPYDRDGRLVSGPPVK